MAMDIAPTILTLAGITHPAPEWNGRQVVPMRGKDLTPWLHGDEQQIHDTNEVFGWELWGREANHRGNWKAGFIPYPAGTSAWQLYELSTDPGESENLASQHPDILAELLDLWETYCEETGVVHQQPELGAKPRAKLVQQNSIAHHPPSGMCSSTPSSAIRLIPQP
jgi:arylsulfatase A-like enzyme